MVAMKRHTSKESLKKAESEISAKKLKVDDASIMAGLRIYVLAAGIGKARSDIFRRQITNMGGTACDEFSEANTHVVVDDKMDAARLSRILKINGDKKYEKLKFVTSLWLSACIRDKRLVDTAEFEIFLFNSASTSKQNSHLSKNESHKLEQLPSKSTDFEKVKSEPVNINPKSSAAENISEIREQDRDSNYTGSDVSDDSEDEKLGETSARKSFALPKGKWLCAQSSAVEKQNFNKHITDKLEEMAKTYETLNDRWRVLGYQKAIMALKKHPKPITSYEEAKGLFGVGTRLAEKIWEIAESGELCKLNELTSQEFIQAVNLFSNIWGAGAQTARAWAQQGFRTLDDLRKNANLTKNQQIGLKYYDELLDRMPRSEAQEIEATVKEAVLEIQPGLTAMACGSYRRGKQTCGDVDVLITHSDGESHTGVYHKLIHRLHETGFLTDDLVSVENDGEHKKYLGVCKLPGPDKKHRRLDIIVVPYNEFACSLMYFTGSAHFNRSLRLLASKRGMSLSEHALCTGVVRSRGEKINKGTPLYTPTEQSIFEHFGLTYRPPEERDH